MNAEKAAVLDYRSQVSFSDHALELALANSSTPIMTTKFSEYSAAFLFMVTRKMPNIPVVWVDTGYNSRATQEYAKKLTRTLNLNLQVYTPLSKELIVPPQIDDPSHAGFTHDVKIEPFARAINELKADTWLSSVKRYQTAHRDTLSVFNEAKYSLLKVSPMLNWSEGQVERFLHENKLVVGPSCYDPTKGEPLRECGLHL